ncbi:MAG TPA: Flp pilus assembly protein CpaB [Gemmataceae bacterium]|jgi:pilus assembly protein CpaB|nr:Flp pilus assembly protein CpaB [Gemmataceae bacterium]
MKPKTLILMVVAIACGLVASYMTSRVIADRSDKPTDEKVTVLVARKNLTMGTYIKDPEQLFEEKQFTKGEEPKKAIRNFEELKDKRLNKPLSAEQFVSPDDVQTKDQDGLSAVMTKGKRAFAIKVDAASSVGGFVLPHSRVDIVSVVQRNENETYSKIILQDILVLAVDQGKDRPDDKQAVIANTVTVQVTPQQAEVLTLAQRLGTLSLLLRAYGDEEKIITGGITPKGITQSGNNDRGEGQDEQFTEGTSRGRPFGIGNIPDVPKNGKPAPTTPVAEVKAVDAPPPPKTHTLTIYNGDAVIRAVFTLPKDKEGTVEKKIDKAPEPTTKPATKTPATKS